MEHIIGFFKKIENNKKVPNFDALTLICIFSLGLVGLSFIASIISIILTNIPEFSTLSVGLQSSIHLFISYFLLLIILCLICFFVKPIWVYLKERITIKEEIIEGIAIAAMTFALATAYSLISNSLFPHGSNNNQDGLQSSFEAQPLLSFFCIVVFAPICEELTYRLGLFGLIAKKSNILAFIVTILIFALIHFDFSAKDIVNELINLPAYLIGAFCLSYAYYRKGSIITSITAHALYNFSQFIIMFIATFILKQ